LKYSLGGSVNWRSQPGPNFSHWSSSIPGGAAPFSKARRLALLVAIQDEIALTRHAPILSRVSSRLHDAEFARRQQQRSAQSNYR
jgi:hypothetical protein